MTAVAASLLCGCDYRYEKASNAKFIQTTTAIRNVEYFEFEGHKYLANYRGGIIHAESCACKVKEEVSR